MKIGMGFPGELADRYPGRIWFVYGFHGEGSAQKGKQVFKPGDKPAYIVTTGTRWEGMPAAGMFTTRGIGDMLDAIVFYGDVSDIVVPADTTELKSKYGAEFERRRRLMDEASKLSRRQ